MTNALEYSLLAGASYFSTRSGINQFPLPQGWSEHVDDRRADAETGFEARVFQSATAIVISYAGTHSKSTADLLADAKLGAGFGSAQLNQAIEYYLQIKSAPESEGKAISLTGHSLGGGLASLVGVFFSVPATAFDESPRWSCCKTPMAAPCNARPRKVTAQSCKSAPASGFRLQVESRPSVSMAYLCR